MAEVLVEFNDPVSDSDGITYTARACGAETTNGQWHGWIEFIPQDGGDPLRSPRETTQPNRTDTVYWATGLSPVYLEGAFERAQNPLVLRTRTIAPPVHDEPAPEITRTAAAPESILNPFSVYRKGESLLRRQLHAFSVWHLVNIVKAYELSSLGADELSQLSAHELIEIIVTAVRARSSEFAT